MFGYIVKWIFSSMKLERWIRETFFQWVDVFSRLCILKKFYFIEGNVKVMILENVLKDEGY